MFRSSNIAIHSIKFNSAISSDFLEMYTGLLDSEIKNKNEGPKQRTFAPSQMRCDRISWFHLRGVEPDKIREADRTLSFTAVIGTACHEKIQKTLAENLGDDWIRVRDWVDSNPEYFSDYDMTLDTHGDYETKIDLRKPYPVRFACDGIVRFKDRVRLLEIKTSEYNSWNELIEPKEEHLDQIKCYATLLHINNVLFLYQDRSYGEFKCFEVNVSESEQDNIRRRMTNIMELAEACIAPAGLPVGDKWCGSNMCPYYKKCSEWGR